MSRQDDLKKELELWQRRLQKRKEQKATQGISADPSIDIEIEDIEAKVEKLQAELAELGNTESQPVLGELFLHEQHYQMALRWANEGRRRGSLARSDLSGADLRAVDLAGANLSLADLSKANLRMADLKKADMRMANLNEADLSRADLRDVNLCEADLYRANLSGANLSKDDHTWEYVPTGVNLRNANLKESNLTRQSGRSRSKRSQPKKG